MSSESMAKDIFDPEEGLPGELSKIVEKLEEARAEATSFGDESTLGEVKACRSRTEQLDNEFDRLVGGEEVANYEPEYDDAEVEMGVPEVMSVLEDMIQEEIARLSNRRDELVKQINEKIETLTT